MRDKHNTDATQMKIDEVGKFPTKQLSEMLLVTLIRVKNIDLIVFVRKRKVNFPIFQSQKRRLYSSRDLMKVKK
jgi:hypothetical protein